MQLSSYKELVNLTVQNPSILSKLQYQEPPPTKQCRTAGALSRLGDNMRIERFEDIEAWKEARNLNKMMYHVSTRGPFKRDLALATQIQRAAISVMANIAEGFDRQSNREFVQYLYIASSSASEIQSHLYAALDLGYVKGEEFETLYEQAQTVKKLINGFIAYLKGKRTK